jgi:hypothetical protein
MRFVFKVVTLQHGKIMMESRWVTRKIAYFSYDLSLFLKIGAYMNLIGRILAENLIGLFAEITQTARI